MLDLTKDSRSASAYSSLVDRNRTDSTVGLVPRKHPAGHALLKMLGSTEALDWLSLAYEVSENPEITWWLVGLTGQRLLGASFDRKARVWSHQRGAWETSLAGTDVVLSLGAGAPLRVRGTSLMSAEQMFGWKAPISDAPTTTSNGRVPDPEFDAEQTSAPEANAEAYVDPTLDDDDDMRAPQFLVHSWQVAEELAAWHLKELGFNNVSLTGAGADGGIDVAADDAAAQVKHYAKSPIGAPAVQQLRGAAVRKDWALFYSLSGYTKSAVDYANAATVALFQYDQNGLVEPRNNAATHLVEARSPDGPPDANAFEQEREVRAVMQQFFDAATSSFFKVAHRAIERATPGSPLLASIQVETDRVKAVIYDLGGNTYPISQAMDRVDQLIEATRRLDQDMERLV